MIEFEHRGWSNNFTDDFFFIILAPNKALYLASNDWPDWMWKYLKRTDWSCFSDDCEKRDEKETLYEHIYGDDETPNQNPFDLWQIGNTPFQNGSIEAKKGAHERFVHFWKALTILMLKKYLKSWVIDTILHVFFEKPNFFSKIFFGLKSSRRSKN